MPGPVKCPGSVRVKQMKAEVQQRAVYPSVVGLLNLPSSAAMAIMSCLQLALSLGRSLNCGPGPPACPGLLLPVRSSLTPLASRCSAPLEEPGAEAGESEWIRAPMVGSTFWLAAWDASLECGLNSLAVVDPEGGGVSGLLFAAEKGGSAARWPFEVAGGPGEGRFAGRDCEEYGFGPSVLEVCARAEGSGGRDPGG